ncbi:MAG: universal stress protein [Candidatus Obscuribacterales bacterium]|nr:universal stress protein [Candidatus Obscuribacterales bacterium]
MGCEISELRILIAVDASKHSELALQSIKVRTWPKDTKFCLCTVVDNPTTVSVNRQNYSEPALTKLQTEMKAAALEVLQQKKADLLESQPDAQIALRLEFGNASDEIIAAALKWDADLIVLGSHGRQGIERYALGSVSESVVERAPCSIEIIKTPKYGRNFLDQKRILVCYDESKNADASLVWIAEGQWSTDQQFVLISVLAPLEDVVPQRFSDIRTSGQMKTRLLAKAQEMLELRCSLLRKCLKNIEINPVVIEGYAAETIIEFAEQWGADLIVLGTHTASTTDSAPLGSVARRVVAGANCFIKLVRNKVVSSSDKWQELDAESVELAL